MSFIKFIGTAGARFVVMKQLRSSGGVWLSAGKANLYIDPGPGALVRCLNSKPKLTILTHSGMTMIKAKPWVVAAELEKELGLRVIAASDGMKLDLEGDLKN